MNQDEINRKKAYRFPSNSFKSKPLQRLRDFFETANYCLDDLTATRTDFHLADIATSPDGNYTATILWLTAEREDNNLFKVNLHKAECDLDPLRLNKSKILGLSEKEPVAYNISQDDVFKEIHEKENQLKEKENVMKSTPMISPLPIRTELYMHKDAAINLLSGRMSSYNVENAINDVNSRSFHFSL